MLNLLIDQVQVQILEYIVEQELSFVILMMSIIVNNVVEQMLLHQKHVPKQINSIQIHIYIYKYKHVKFVKDHHAFFFVHHLNHQMKEVFQLQNIMLLKQQHEYDDSNKK
jgi:hypothetical protein